MPFPATVTDHQQKVGRISLALLLALRQLWRGLDPAGSWEDQYTQTIGPRILALTLAAQTRVTADTDAFMARFLAELGYPPSSPGLVPASAFAGLAGDGREVSTLLASSVGRARASERQRIEIAGVPGAASARPTEDLLRDSLADGERFLELVTATVLADTARAAETAAMGGREYVAGWVRVISPPCCSRCAVLGGRFYRWSDGFLRHPGCDCKHVPAPPAGPALDELLQAETPERYFDSLDREEQDRTFTRDGAAAIRAGADMGQVVNARKGMTTAQDAAGRERQIRTDVNGRMTFVTTAGTGRRGRPGVARLMPEALAEIAGDDRSEFIRLLSVHGYIT